MALAQWVYACFCICAYVMTSRFLKPKLPGPVADNHVYPTHCPRGSQDEDHCSGSVCSHTHMKHGLGLHRAQIWLIPKKGGGRPSLLFCTNVHTQTHTARNNSYITGLERGPCGSPHLPKTDVKNKSETSSDWRKAPHCCNSTNSQHSTLTEEQTAAHDNTH